MDNLEEAMDILLRSRARVALSIDDFGRVPSLSRLSSSPQRADRQGVHHGLGSEAETRDRRRLVSMAHSMHLSVVAEGFRRRALERLRTWAAMRSRDCCPAGRALRGAVVAAAAPAAQPRRQPSLTPAAYPYPIARAGAGLGEPPTCASRCHTGRRRLRAPAERGGSLSPSCSAAADCVLLDVFSPTQRARVCMALPRTP